ncbi:MAG: site-specific integrase [Marinilabiliaceae bacterium]|nr:site-specific integrase [Marinilabiliaceae bacterium]
MKATYKLIHNRAGKLNSEGKALIQLRIIHNRKTRFFSTGIYVKPGEWSDKDGGIIVKHPNAIKYNAIIRDLRQRIEAVELEAISQGRTFDLQAVNPDGGCSVDSLIDFMYAELEQERGKLSETTYVMTKSFIESVNKSAIFTTIGSATLANVERFDSYLRRTYPSVQTINLKHSKLRKYLYVAVKRGLLAQNPYQQFKLTKPAENKRKYLSFEQLAEIRDKELIPRLSAIRDMFLLSCYTGLAYSDVSKLKKADIYQHNGTMFIVTDRTKTDEESSIPLLPQAAEIIEKYAPKKRGADERLLPIPSNQKFNAYLKEIQTICNIPINLTHHIARHTFATTITLENGVPLETVSRMLGHANIKTTQIYAKMTRKRLADDMSDLASKLVDIKKGSV